MATHLSNNSACHVTYIGGSCTRTKQISVIKNIHPTGLVEKKHCHFYADQRHMVTDHDAKAFCATPLYERLSFLARLFFPSPKRAHGLLPARIYTNAMMFGDVAHIHRDGNSEGVTALLYPNEQWAPSLSVPDVDDGDPT